jgi:Ser/Thr protein kinase RdoA (MazF antagonist)
MTREGALLSLLAGRSVPTVLGHDGGRCLLAEVPGTDLYEARLSQLVEMVTLLVDLQAGTAGKLDSFFAAGLPDWRGPALMEAVESVIQRTAHEIAVDDVRVLSTFVAGLPQRFDALDACGVSDTLVHGDFHPDNFRGDDADLTLLDWGDSGVGHPLLDQPAFLDRVPADCVATVREHWLRCWRGHLPGADPERAARLLSPIAAARQAVIYRRFLDHIEPSEHPYHRADPADGLRRTALLLQDEGPSARSST